MKEQNSNSKDAYTPKYVMQELDISRPTLNDWCVKGILRKIQVPGARRVYISKQSYEKLLSDSK